MKIILKTVSGKQHEISVEMSQTVHDIKLMMETEYEAGSIRLVYKGAILQDDKTVEEVQLAENDVMVITGKRRGIGKPAAKAPESTSTTTTTTASVSADAPTQPPAPSTTTVTAPPIDTAAANVPAPTTETVSAPPAPSSSAPPPPPSTTAAIAEGNSSSGSGGGSGVGGAPAAVPAVSTLTPASEPPAPAVDQSLVDNIVAMGFEDRTQVALALRAAYMNPDRAVEYLCSGIPPHLLRELTPAQTQSATPAAPVAPAHATPEESSVAQLRAALNTIPQFDQIRAIFSHNPETMSVILHQIAQRYPEIYSLINANPAAFIEIISEPSSANRAEAVAQSGQSASEHGTVFDPQQIMATLTDADRTAVSELVSLGGGMWDEQSAAIVYLSLQRNKELAASVLFEHGGVPTALMAALTAPHNHQGGGEEEDSDETLDQSD